LGSSHPIAEASSSVLRAEDPQRFQDLKDGKATLIHGLALDEQRENESSEVNTELNGTMEIDTETTDEFLENLK
jgi:geranylgeranyl pyrophosphate synthase